MHVALAITLIKTLTLGGNITHWDPTPAPTSPPTTAPTFQPTDHGLWVFDFLGKGGVSTGGAVTAVDAMVPFGVHGAHEYGWKCDGIPMQLVAPTAAATAAPTFPRAGTCSGPYLGGESQSTMVACFASCTGSCEFVSYCASTKSLCTGEDSNK